ncbi:hypothetical protein ACFVG1_12885 [Streptomyces bacillaris]|uniref:hypothetical protein n=1 Tax=Streptomyces bacillaris TaxID=68179 RepID=UPI0035E2B5BB
MPSSVEPAIPAGHHAPGPPGPATPPGDSRVVPFTTRATRTGRGRRTPQPPPPDRAATTDTPQQRLAETAEAWFLKRGGTLTDETTADTYRATLDLVQLMLDGSLHEHLIGDGEHRHLTGMMRGLRDAPDSL